MHYSAQPRTTESRKIHAAVDGLRPAILVGVVSNLAHLEKCLVYRAASNTSARPPDSEKMILQTGQKKYCNSGDEELAVLAISNF